MEKYIELLRSLRHCIALTRSGHILEPVSLHICCLDHKDLNPTTLSKHIPYQKVSPHHQYHRHSGAALDNRLLSRLGVPSLANLEELVSRRAGDYD